MKYRFLGGLAVLCLLAGCDKQEETMERPAPGEQKVVMVPAHGQNQANQAGNKPSGQTPTPNSTPDGPQPGDK